MRGLTDAEYALLQRAAQPGLEFWWPTTEETVLLARMLGVGRLQRFQGYVYGPSALGRLALSLWPAIRSGQ